MPKKNNKRSHEDTQTNALNDRINTLESLMAAQKEKLKKLKEDFAGLALEMNTNDEFYHNNKDNQKAFLFMFAHILPLPLCPLASPPTNNTPVPAYNSDGAITPIRVTPSLLGT